MRPWARVELRSLAVNMTQAPWPCRRRTLLILATLAKSLYPTMCEGLISFTSGKSDDCASVAASAVLPLPAGASRREGMSRVGTRTSEGHRFGPAPVYLEARPGEWQPAVCGRCF